MSLLHIFLVKRELKDGSVQKHVFPCAEVVCVMSSMCVLITGVTSVHTMITIDERLKMVKTLW